MKAQLHLQEDCAFNFVINSMDFGLLSMVHTTTSVFATCYKLFLMSDHVGLVTLCRSVDACPPNTHWLSPKP